MSPCAPCYVVCHLVQSGGEHYVFPLKQGVWGAGLGGSMLLTPGPTPAASFSLVAVPLSCPGLASSTVPRERLPPGPATQHRLRLVHIIGAWASVGFSHDGGSTDTLPAVLFSYDNFDPPRFVCTPASLLALSSLTQPQSIHPTHTHKHTPCIPLQ